MRSTIVAPLLFAPLAFAATHQVTVGPGLNYSPNTVTAATGDVVEFQFGSGHDVVSGSFDSPCQPSGGIYSGEPSEGDIFSVTINGTDPIYIYCSVTGHCRGGMVMAINPPSSGNTLDAYRSAASSASGSSHPNDVEGGVFGAVSGSSSSSSSSEAASASSSASAAASSASSAAGAATSSASATVSSASASASSAASHASTAASASSSGSAARATGLVADFGMIAGAVVGGLALAL